jgi:hypothetical protein
MSQTIHSRLAAAIVCLLLAACGSLPDARPFADATGTWSASVKASGQALADSLRDAGSVEPADKNAYEQDIKKFEEAWSARIKAAQGAVAYSSSIADVVAAAGETGQTVNKVADSLGALAGASGITLAGPTVSVVSDVAKFVGAQVAIVRVSRKLEDAVAQAQPAVDSIAEHLVSESDRQLKPTLERAHKNIASGIKQQYDADSNFAAAVAKRLEQARTDALKDPAKAASLQELDRMLAAVGGRLKERDQRLDQAAASYKARLQLINALSTTTLAWAAAHRDLAGAIRDKRKVNAAELQETIGDLRDLIKKVRAL